MTIDAATAGLIGAGIGAFATFGGQLVTGTLQAFRERGKRREEREVEAYANTLRYLLRAAHLPVSGGPDFYAELTRWSNDLVDAAYWLTILTTVCSKSQRSIVSGAAMQLIADTPKLKNQGFSSAADLLGKIYIEIAQAARNDIGLA